MSRPSAQGVRREAPVGQSAVRDFAYEGLPGRVIFGPGRAHRELRAEVERLEARRVLVIAAEAEAELARELCEPLAELVAGHFERVQPHVPVEVAASARESARACEADCLLCIGGSSTTGTAKAIALKTELPILAVPSTYAGSEMTTVWGSTEASRKTTGRSMSVLPKTVIYDPELTFGLPARITAASGMNAIAHCAEALYAPGRNPITALVALEGIRALAQALPVAVQSPEGLAGRSGALYGAYLAGSAFAVAGSGLHHKICHALGGAYDLPHAETHSIVLPHVIAFQQPAAPETIDLVARALGAPEGGAASGLYELAGRLGLPLALSEVGMPPDGVEPVIEQIVQSAPADNPRRADADAVRGILTAALTGASPP